MFPRHFPLEQLFEWVAGSKKTGHCARGGEFGDSLQGPGDWTSFDEWECKIRNQYDLVGGLEHFLLFHILGIVIPTDFHIFQRGRYTTNQSFNQQELGCSCKIEIQSPKVLGFCPCKKTDNFRMEIDWGFLTSTLWSFFLRKWAIMTFKRRTILNWTSFHCHVWRAYSPRIEDCRNVMSAVWQSPGESMDRTNSQDFNLYLYLSI